MAVQTCRVVCWLHRCGLISGDITPDSFVIPSGGASLLADRLTYDGGCAAAAGPGARGYGGAGALRLVTARSVSRRSDAAGGSPRHPLLEVRIVS